MVIKTYHLIIRGKVQGVGYRNWALTQALSLGINGWVRNVKDGCVEMVCTAEENTLSEMLQACKKGPPLAQVSTIEHEIVDIKVGEGFTIR